MFVVILCLDVTSAQQNQTLTACEYGSGPGTISCSLGKEINILGVLYGRTHDLPNSACNVYNVQINNFNCIGGNQPNTFVQNTCARQNKCTIDPNDIKQFPDPCSGVPKFLKVDYQCISPTPAPTTTTGASVMTSSGTALTSTQSQTTTLAQTTVGQTTTTAGQTTSTSRNNPRTFRTTTLAPNVCKSVSVTLTFTTQIEEKQARTILSKFKDIFNASKATKAFVKYLIQSASRF